MSRIVKVILTINLIVVAVLVFVYPNLMVAPGKLIPGHLALATDCFACHAPLTGVQSARCVTCHKPEEIGRLTTAGEPVVKPLSSTPFHQRLVSQDCTACHSDHAGVKRFQALGHFKHNMLNPATREQCQDCHKAPTDPLHQPIGGNCKQCHSQDRWTPATFDHDKAFALDRDHRTECATCHVRNDYSRYTCYGCHEHSPESIRRKHVEEGIRDFKNCVECHRNADEHDIRGRNTERSSRRDAKHDDD